ncbi:MAG: hypothetical protein KDC70_05820 [Saprospiraceae bacterium]|nr:hypothetical protein [Saprospiraceae bacterium]
MRTFRFFYHATAIFLGLIFFTSGMAKLYAGHKFPGVIGPVWLADRLEEYDLGLYARFIAASQISIGFSLLVPRFRTLGAIMLVPMIANILMVTISMKWQGTPYVLAFLLLLNAGLLIYDAPRLMHLITGKPHPFKEAEPPRRWKGHLAWLAGLALVFCGIGVSYSVLSLSYLLVVSGILLAWFSARLDGSAHSNN